MASRAPSSKRSRRGRSVGSNSTAPTEGKKRTAAATAARKRAKKGEQQNEEEEGEEGGGEEEEMEEEAEAKKNGKRVKRIPAGRGRGGTRKKVSLFWRYQIVCLLILVVGVPSLVDKFGTMVVARARWPICLKGYCFCARYVVYIFSCPG